MMRAIVMAGGLLGLIWSLPAWAHGCHHAWQQSTVQGWHSHGAKCDARRGIGVSRRARPSSRRPV